MQSGDLLFYNGTDDLWTEPTIDFKREGENRRWVGIVVEPAEELTDVIVKLRVPWDGVETLCVGELLDEIAVRSTSDDPVRDVDPEEVHIATSVW